MKRLMLWSIVALCPALSFTMPLQLIGEYQLPTETSFEALQFGGISGITYDPEKQRYYAISDARNRQEDGPARFYTLAIEMNADGITDVEILNMHLLTDPTGTPWPEGEVDAEGIALTPDKNGLYWASELGAGLQWMDFSGKQIEAYSTEIPTYYAEQTQGEFGARYNNLFEGLSITPDQKTLFMAMESALKQDGSQATVSSSSPARILKYTIDQATNAPQLVGEYLYNVDPIPIASSFGPSDNGVSEILALNEHTLLLLERSGRSVSENHQQWEFNIRLFLVDLSKSTNILGLERIQHAKDPRMIQPAFKEKILSFSDISDNPDNLEAITFGPEISGHQTLLFVSDNNFQPHQRTQFYLFLDHKDQLKKWAEKGANLTP